MHVPGLLCFFILGVCLSYVVPFLLSEIDSVGRVDKRPTKKRAWMRWTTLVVDGAGLRLRVGPIVEDNGWPGRTKGGIELASFWWSSRDDARNCGGGVESRRLDWKWWLNEQMSKRKGRSSQTSGATWTKPSRAKGESFRVVLVVFGGLALGSGFALAFNWGRSAWLGAFCALLYFLRSCCWPTEPF